MFVAMLIVLTMQKNCYQSIYKIHLHHISLM